MSNGFNIFSPRSLRLAAHLLGVAADEFSRHGCNDLRLDEVTGFEDAEARRELVRAFHEWNGDPEEFDPADDCRYEYDSSMMSFLSDMFERAADKMELHAEHGGAVLD